jgi:hypothetical protein
LIRVSAGGAMLEPWDSGTLDALLGKADQELNLRRSLRREGSPATRRPRLRRLTPHDDPGVGYGGGVRTGLLLTGPR